MVKYLFVIILFLCWNADGGKKCLLAQQGGLGTQTFKAEREHVGVTNGLLIVLISGTFQLEVTGEHKGTELGVLSMGK